MTADNIPTHLCKTMLFIVNNIAYASTVVNHNELFFSVSAIIAL